MSKRFFWPVFFTVPILVLFVILGNWQVERLVWKLDIIQKIEDRFSRAPVPLPQQIEIQDFNDYIYMSVKMTGRFNYSQEMHFYGVGPSGKAGYDLFTPFEVEGGGTVIVNRGWVPEKLKEQSSRPLTLIKGQHEISGHLRKPWGGHWSGPENQLAKNQWFYGALQEMGEYQKIESLYPLYVYQTKVKHEGGLPIGGRSNLNIVNNHLDYAMTWYGLAIVVVVMFGLFAYKLRKEAMENPDDERDEG